MLYKEYDNDVLKRLQQIEMEILRDFDDMCEKHGIRYFGCGGTAIGVVRHGGFIPWDDDIDIAMTRKDYEKFLKVAMLDEYSDRYKLVNAQTIPSYPLMTSRWCRKGTKFKEESLGYIPDEMGIFLDIFCFDNIPDNDLMMKIHAWRCWLWGKLLILYWLDTPVLYDSGIIKTLELTGCRIAHKMLRLLPISPKFLYSKAEKITREFENKKTRRVNYLHDPKPCMSIMNKSDIFPIKKMKFGDLMISEPKNIHAYLKQRYGDGYMVCPPEEKRHNHPPYELDLGK